MRCGCCGGSCCGRPAQKCPLNQVCGGVAVPPGGSGLPWLRDLRPPLDRNNGSSPRSPAFGNFASVRSQRPGGRPLIVRSPGTPFLSAPVPALAADRRASPARDRLARLGCATSPASGDNRDGRREGERREIRTQTEADRAPKAREIIRRARVRCAGSGVPDEAMNWHRWLATLFVMLALVACAQEGQVPYAPYSPENIHDRGGDGGVGAM
jgi:hypothetical protein